MKWHVYRQLWHKGSRLLRILQGEPPFHSIFQASTLLPHVGHLSCRIGPVLFAGRRSYEVTKVALVFVLILCCSISVFRMNVCFCCNRFSFCSTTPRDWLGRTSPKWPVLCRVGRETLTQCRSWFCCMTPEHAFSAWNYQFLVNTFYEENGTPHPLNHSLKHVCILQCLLHYILLKFSKIGLY